MITLDYNKRAIKISPVPTFLVNDTLNVSQDQKREIIINDFIKYKERIQNTCTIITLDDKSVNYIEATSKSRYFIGGRIKMQRNIKKRLGARWYSPGVLLTLTYDPKKITKFEAWEKISQHKKTLLHALYIRNIRNHSKGLKYLWAVENQPGTGYPHIHVFFPGLNYLMPSGELKNIWSWGRVNVIHKDNINCASYLCKYLAKLEDWDIESQAEIWANKTRVYGYSVIYRLPRPDIEKIASGSYGGSYEYKGGDRNEIKQDLLLNRLMGGYHPGYGWSEFIEEAKN